MENFQEMITQAAEMKEYQLKKDRKQFESLPSYLKTGLNYSKKYEQLRLQHFSFQMFVSDCLKNDGNELVSKQSFEQALAKYEEALAVFRWIDTATNQNLKDSDLKYGKYEPEQQHSQTLDSHISKLYLNISLCLTKLNRKHDAVSAAEEAIKMDQNNAKAYYRKGQAYVQYINREEQDVKEGLKWLQCSYEISKDPHLYNEMVAIKKKVVEERQKAKKAFSFIINNGAKENETLKPTAEEKQKKQHKQVAQPKAGADEVQEEKPVQVKPASDQQKDEKCQLVADQIIEMQDDPVGLRLPRVREEVQERPRLERRAKRTTNPFAAHQKEQPKHQTKVATEKLAEQKTSHPQVQKKTVNKPLVTIQQKVNYCHPPVIQSQRHQQKKPVQVKPCLLPSSQKQEESKQQPSQQQPSQSQPQPPSPASIPKPKAEREHQTEERLRQLMNNPNWQLQLLEQFILRNGRKIATIMDVYNYREYIHEHDELLRKCLMLQKRFAVGSVEFQQDGQTHKLLMSNPEVAEAVAQEKMTLYSEYMNWLERHPIEQLKKYLIRYDSHRKFILKEIEKRDFIIIESRRKPAVRASNSSNLLLLYFVIFMVAAWLGVNLYRLWQHQ